MIDWNDHTVHLHPSSSIAANPDEVQFVIPKEGDIAGLMTLSMSAPAHVTLSIAGEPVWEGLASDGSINLPQTINMLKLNNHNAVINVNTAADHGDMKMCVTFRRFHDTETRRYMATMKSSFSDDPLQWFKSPCPKEWVNQMA